MRVCYRNSIVYTHIHTHTHTHTKVYKKRQVTQRLSHMMCIDSPRHILNIAYIHEYMHTHKSYHNSYYIYIYTHTHTHTYIPRYIKNVKSLSASATWCALIPPAIYWVSSCSSPLVSLYLLLVRSLHDEPLGLATEKSVTHGMIGWYVASPYLYVYMYVCMYVCMYVMSCYVCVCM